MDRKLRICYFAEQTIHTWRWLDHFTALGHEVFIFTGFASGFRKWPIPLPERTGPNLDQAPRSVPVSVPRSISRLRPIYSVLRPIYSRAMRMLEKPRELHGMARQLRHHVAAVAPDIVHALWLWDNALYAHAAGFHPYVVTPWGSDIWKIDYFRKGKSRRLRQALDSADAVTAGVQALLDGCQQWGARTSRCHLIAAPGIDIAHFEKPTADLLPALHELQKKGTIIFCPRSMAPLYHLDKVVQAFGQLLKTRPQCHLLLLDAHAAPGYRDEVLRLISQLALGAHVTILDRVPYEQMPHLYALSAVVVSLAECDAIPQSGYEALAAGRPLIVSDLPQYDGVLDHEQTVLRVPWHDPAAVARALLRVLEDSALRQRLATNGRNLARDRGDMRREMGKLEALFFQLAPIPADLNHAA